MLLLKIMRKSFKDFFSIFISDEFLRSFKGKLSIFLLIAAINIFWLYVAKTTHNPNGNKIYFTSGAELDKDIYSAEYLIEHGTYYFGKNFRGEDDYTYRMPGHLFLYLPCRLFFGIEGTIFAQVIFNLILSILASYLLACIVYGLTRKPLYFWLALLLFLGSGYVQHFNFGAGREATTTYVLIISFYLYQKWQEDKKTYRLVLFSLLLTWSILYRPFLGPPIYIAFIIFVYQQWKCQKKLPLKLSLILFLPSFLFFSYWIPRNYVLTGKFVPLEASELSYSESYQTIPKLINTWSGEVLPWIKDAEAAWFTPPEWNNSEWDNDNLIPDFVFNDTLTIGLLKEARDYYRLAHDYSNVPTIERIKYDEKATSILKQFIYYQKKEYPFRSYIGSKIISLGRFIYQPIGLPVRSLFYPFNIILAYTTSFFNILIIAGGFIVSSLLIFKNKKTTLTLLSIIFALYLTLLFPIVFDIELRRIAHAIPFFLINILVFSNVYLGNSIKKMLTLSIISLLLISLSAYSCITYIRW